MIGEAATVAFLGFPRTGKSTYLGALWQLAQDPEEPTIVERDVTGDRSYLQELGDRVARGEEIERTRTASDDGMQLTLGLGTGDIVVDIPDLGGETLRLLVEERVWHSRLQETLVACDAMVLFLHPERLRMPMSIAMADEVLADHRASQGRDASEAGVEQRGDSGAETQPPEFRRGLACTAAQCVDALENVLMHQRARWPIRLAVVISAWDTVDGSPTPAHWLADRVPALGSFARSNADMIEWNLYGVSAQGGTLPADREELLARGSVRRRVFARSADGHPVPLVEPLRWVLGN